MAKKQKLSPERQAIRDLDCTLAASKVQVADALAGLRQAEEAASRCQQAYIAAVVALAKSEGIDLDDQSQKWHFDGVTLQFSRLQEGGNGQ